MDRMKTFFKYFLLVVICYFGSNSLIYAAINNSYQDIAIYQEKTSNGLDMSGIEAKATMVNGYVKGTIKNNSNRTIMKKYIIIELYSDNNVKMGTKYLEVTNLKPGGTVNIDLNFKYSNVSYCVIDTVDNMI